MAAQSRKTTIAIVGGGIAGLTTAIGLQKYPHLDVHVYESAKAFGEIGAGVVIGPNSQRAMELIDPRILVGYNRQAAFSTEPVDENGLHPWMTVCKGQEPDAGETIIQFKHKAKGSSIHRAHFLNEVVKLVNPGRVQTHFGKRLDHLEEAASPTKPTKLHFKDSTTALADIVIGADGVHSIVRPQVLGPENPASRAFFTGIVQYRSAIPISVAKAKLGAIEQRPRTGWGKDGSIFGFPITDKLFYIGVTVCGLAWVHDRWSVKADLRDVKTKFEDWNEYSRTLVNLLPEDGKTMAWSIWEMPPASTYYRNNMVLVGDAAHASTPFKGAGAGQAIEDALVLEKLLGKYLDPEYPQHVENVSPLLQAYDTVRRFRSQKVVTSSRETGRISTMNEPGVGWTAKEVREAVSGMQEWIWDHDQEQMVKDAFQLVDEMIDARSRLREGKREN